MRHFNHREKQIINLILEAQSEKNVSLQKLLQGFYFTEEKGRALIIQAQSHYAVLFLQSSVFDEELKKKAELELFLELVSLISYLRQEGYIIVYRERNDKMYFLQDAFVNPKPVNNLIVLNAKGDYTESADTIYDKDKQVLYKGIIFEADIFTLILNTTAGVLIVSQRLKELITDQEIVIPSITPLPDAVVPDYQSDTEDNSSAPNEKKDLLQDKNRKGFGSISFRPALCLALFFLIFMSCVLYGAYRINDYEKRLSEITKSQDSLTGKQEINMIKGKEISDESDTSPFSNAQEYYGIDISHWNGKIIDDIPVIDSITFIICKATDGTMGLDPDFAFNWMLIKNKGLIRGAYHFYRAGEDPIQQAEFYWSNVKSLDSTDIAPIIDIEELSLSSTSPDNNNLQINLLLFIKHLELLSHRSPIIYSDLSFANTHLLHESLGNYDLWLAEYSDKAYPIVPEIWKDKGFKIWQKSDRYDINSNTVDYDVFYGELSDLHN